MITLYCEHGALTPELRALQRDGSILLVHFPYDTNSRSKHLRVLATPSEAQWRDLNVTWDEAAWTWDDESGSELLGAINTILGTGNRRDALHLDSAFKSGCLGFATRDRGILRHAAELRDLLGIAVFDPHDVAALRAILGTTTPE